MFLSKNRNEIDYFTDPDRGGRIILKWALEK
jgi:hypothetical protein